MQVLLSLLLQTVRVVTDLRQVIGFAAAIALAFMAAWGSWQLTDLVMSRRQRLDEE